jgi:predicted DNA-binding transcriptional regulator AlpA
MSRRIESKTDAIDRARREFHLYSDEIILSEPMGAAAAGFSEFTFKDWRLNSPGTGPDPVYILERVGYRAGTLRAWLADRIANGRPPKQSKALAKQSLMAKPVRRKPRPSPSPKTPPSAA